MSISANAITLFGDAIKVGSAVQFFTIDVTNTDISDLDPYEGEQIDITISMSRGSFSPDTCWFTYNGTVGNITESLTGTNILQWDTTGLTGNYSVVGHCNDTYPTADTTLAEWVYVYGSKPNGEVCTSNDDCISLNCRKDISSATKYCAAIDNECGEEEGDGYDTEDIEGSWICVDMDESYECSVAMRCDEYASHYCDGVDTWELGSSHGQDGDCNKCQYCGGSASIDEGDLDCTPMPNDVQDTEGSNTCDGECEKCSSGSCADQDGEDLFSDCIEAECGTGTCSSGSCGYYTSGERDCPACQTCDGADSTSCVEMSDDTQDTEGAEICNALCKKCSSGSCVNQGDEDLFGDCAIENCGTGSCQSGAGVCDWFTSGEGECAACQTCDGASSVSCEFVMNHDQDDEGSNTCTDTCYECDGAGNCVAQSEDQDYFSQCGSIECDDGASPPWYWGWDTLVCYYSYDVSAADAKCDGAGACKVASDYCSSQPQGSDTGTSCDCTQAQDGCEDNSAGSCDNNLCDKSYFVSFEADPESAEHGTAIDFTADIQKETYDLDKFWIEVEGVQKNITDIVDGEYTLQWNPEITDIGNYSVYGKHNDTEGNLLSSDEIFVHLYNSPPTAEFNYQIPADIDVYNLFEQDLNISWNITDDLDDVDDTSIKIWYVVNDSGEYCWKHVNGTSTCEFESDVEYSKYNNTDTYVAMIKADKLLPATYPIDHDTMTTDYHSSSTLDSTSEMIKCELFNISSTKEFGLFMSMVKNQTSLSKQLQLIYCNENYATGLVNESEHCAQFGAITQSYNHTVSDDSSYVLSSFGVDLTENTIGGVNVTDHSWFIFVPSVTSTDNGWKIYHISQTVDDEACQLSTSAGVSWAPLSGTVDFYAQQYSGNEEATIFIESCDEHGSCGNSTLRTDEIDIRDLDPTAPSVYSPTGDYEVGTTIDINYTAAVAFNSEAIDTYNVSVFDSELNLITTLSNSNSGLGLLWDTTSYNTDLEYIIGVQAKDSNAQKGGFGLSKIITLSSLIPATTTTTTLGHHEYNDSYWDGYNEDLIQIDPITGEPTLKNITYPEVDVEYEGVSSYMDKARALWEWLNEEGFTFKREIAGQVLVLTKLHLILLALLFLYVLKLVFIDD
jgi:hypothetical protein